MKLIKGKKANENYLAKVVNIKVFRKHSNPEVTRLKCATIDGFNIITSIDAEPGLYIYFPTACCINPNLLSYNNLFRHKELNNNPEKTGLFEDNGKVKVVKLKGELSEGFIMPAVDFTNWINASKLNFRPMDKFGPAELEERQKLLFEIVKCIWGS